MTHIFVFGSNLDGVHGAGAAKYALRKYGAVWGVGEGRTGDSYALPTQGHGLVDMSLAQIEVHIARFLEYARLNHDTTFALTPVGCGLAGHNKRDIWGILKKYGLPRNVYLTSTWVTDDTS